VRRIDVSGDAVAAPRSRGLPLAEGFMADRTDLEDAARTVRSAPHSTAAWDEVEGLAATHDKPDAVVALYRDVLKAGPEAQIAEMVGERAAHFCDEWFGDEPDVLEGILARVLELSPQSESALQRLSVLYTVGERWRDLLRLYDRALGRPRTPSAASASSARRRSSPRTSRTSPIRPSATCSACCR
jgi:hypothetical protein